MPYSDDKDINRFSIERMIDERVEKAVEDLQLGAQIENYLATEDTARHLNARSLPTQKIRPTDLSGARPSDSAPLVYDSNNDLVTFEGASTGTPAGRIYLTSNETLTSVDRSWVRPGSISSTWSKDYDYGGVADAANERVTAPVDGVYQINWSVTWGTTNNTTVIAGSRLYKGGIGLNIYGSHFSASTNGTSTGLLKANSVGSCMLPLSAGEYIQPYGYWGYSSTGGNWGYTANVTWIDMALVRAT